MKIWSSSLEFSFKDLYKNEDYMKIFSWVLRDLFSIIYKRSLKENLWRSPPKNEISKRSLRRKKSFISSYIFLEDFASGALPLFFSLNFNSSPCRHRLFYLSRKFISFMKSQCHNYCYFYEKFFQPYTSVNSFPPLYYFSNKTSH